MPVPYRLASFGASKSFELETGGTIRHFLALCNSFLIEKNDIQSSTGFLKMKTVDSASTSYIV
jgi:hypothetical protein